MSVQLINDVCTFDGCTKPAWIVTDDHGELCRDHFLQIRGNAHKIYQEARIEAEKFLNCAVGRKAENPSRE